MSIRDFLKSAGVSIAALYVLNTPANEELHFQITKKANTMLPQFSYRSRSGEVILLREKMPRNQQTGTIQGGTKNMRAALEKVRPDLLQEFDEAAEKQKQRIERAFEEIDKHFQK